MDDEGDPAFYKQGVLPFKKRRRNIGLKIRVKNRMYKNCTGEVVGLSTRSDRLQIKILTKEGEKTVVVGDNKLQFQKLE